MKLIPGVRTAFKSLRTQKGRAVLMMLGVIVGVGMLTSIIAMNEYARSKVERGFRSMMGGARGMSLSFRRIRPRHAACPPAMMSKKHSLSRTRRLSGLKSLMCGWSQRFRTAAPSKSMEIAR